jgi:hypothetical protein
MVLWTCWRTKRVSEKQLFRIIHSLTLFVFALAILIVTLEPVECKKAKESVWEKVSIPIPIILTLSPCQRTIVWICKVWKKREWVRKSLCSKGQQETGSKSVMGEKSLLMSVVSTCVFLCFLLISCFALVNEAHAI